MTVPEVVLCPDGHFRLIIWGIGPYIADYPEQLLLCCIVQGWCPRYIFFDVLSISFLWLFCLRCRAPSGELDNHEGIYEQRSRDHTDFLATRCEMNVLYDNYGIIGDVIVCSFYVFYAYLIIIISLLQMNFHTPIFMNLSHLLTISIAGELLLHYLNLFLIRTHLVLRSLHRLQVFAISLRVEGLSSGPVMIQKLWWRYVLVILTILNQ